MGDNTKCYAWFNDDGAPYWWFATSDSDYGEPTLTIEVDADLLQTYHAARSALDAANAAVIAAAGLDPNAGRLLNPCDHFHPDSEPYTHTRPDGTQVTWYGDCTTCGHSSEAHQETDHG